MSVFNSTKFGIGALIVAASIGGGAVGLSVPADASPLSYVQQLNNRGILIYDTVAALKSGYAICAALNTYNGADVLQAIPQAYVDATPQTAAIFLQTAVEELCPWHDHREVVA